MVQRGLPIPTGSSIASASGAVAEEVTLLVRHDRSHNAAGGGGKDSKRKGGKKKGGEKRAREEQSHEPTPLEGVTEAELLAARRELSKEWNAQVWRVLFAAIQCCCCD